jgi:antitoxin VapB
VDIAQQVIGVLALPLSRARSSNWRRPARLTQRQADEDVACDHGRQGDELRIRPAQRRMGDVLGKLAGFSPDFMSQGRAVTTEGGREAL